MRVVIASVPARSVALAVAAAATIGVAAGTSLAAPARDAGARTVFHGRTQQGIGVRLGPARGATRAFRYQARMKCSDGSTFTDDAFTDVVRIRRDMFSRSVVSDAGAVHTWVKGTVSGRRAHGTIRITERYSEVPDANGDTPLNADGGILCDSGSVRWSAMARG
jgi:hypothetical protein